MMGTEELGEIERVLERHVRTTLEGLKVNINRRITGE